ncbi:MAG TPA: hypothetical protein VK179_15470 [Bacteroidales bacterium]|nr:hypothetical protein [Bacteroidales bacterium]
MKTSNNLFLLSVAAGFLAVSCQKDSVDTPETSKSLDIKMEATNASFSLQKSTAAASTFIWDSSYMVVSKIEFEAEKGDSQGPEISYEWKGPRTIDLLGLNNFVGSISLPPGVYHEVSLKLVAYQSDAGSSPVFYLSGIYINAAGTEIPVVLEMNEDIELRVKQEGYLLDASVDYTSLIHMNLSLLFDGISASDLDGATLTDGTIVINSASNADIYNTVLYNLSTCSEYHFSEGRLEAGDDHGSHSGNDSSSDAGDDRGSNSGNDSGSDSGNDHGTGY